MDELEKAQPLLAFLEFQAMYASPNFEFPTRASAVMSAVFQAFRPWNINLANVSAKQNPANAGEMAIVFSLLNSQLTFSVGIGAATLVATNPDWSQEHLISEVVTAGLQAVQSSTGVTFEHHLLSLLMHVKPELRSLGAVSEHFLSLKSSRISNTTFKARGFSVYADDFSWIVDASAMYAEAFFIKIVRRSPPNTSLPEMARLLRADQAELLGALQLRMD